MLRCPGIFETLVIAVYTYIKDVSQDHPRHDSDLLDHTQRIIFSLGDMFREDLFIVGLLHDVGKVTTKARHKKLPQDTFYGHSHASVEWVESQQIRLTEYAKNLILHHDVEILSISDMDKWHGKFGGEWVLDLYALREADLLAQKQSHPDVIRNLEETREARKTFVSLMNEEPKEE